VCWVFRAMREVMWECMHVEVVYYVMMTLKNEVVMCICKYHDHNVAAMIS
jgi:hypothetical protein